MCPYSAAGNTGKKRKWVHELIAADVVDVQALRQLIEKRGCHFFDVIHGYENKKQIMSLLFKGTMNEMNSSYAFLGWMLPDLLGSLSRASLTVKILK